MSLVYRCESSGRSGEIRNGIFLGGKSDAKDLAFLHAKNITHILNVTPPKEAGVQAGVSNFFESSNKFVYKRIEVYDAPTSDLLSHADEVVKFISTSLCHGSVLVHCQQGVSRSTTCVAFYLMRKVGMSLIDAMAMIKEKRTDARPIPRFMEQLNEYETKCRALGIISEQIPKKRIIGSSGPQPRGQIGPIIPQHSHGKTKRQKLMGPSIGPAMLPIESQEPSSSSIKPEIPPKAGRSLPDVGPALPPTLDAATNGPIETEQKS